MSMKVLFVFNHPAPYKVSFFNELAKKVDLHVIFERKQAKDRDPIFYAQNVYNFSHTFINRRLLGNENCYSLFLRKYIRKYYKNYDLIIMNGYSQIAEQFAINYMINHKIPYILFINGGIIKFNENKIIRALKRRYVSNAKYLFSPNQKASNYLKFYGAKGKIFEYPYSTFYNREILKFPLTPLEKATIRGSLKLPDGKLFISASNFIERKNNEELILLFKGLNASLYLYGDGPLKETYLKIIKENNIDNVFIKNYLSKKELMNIMKAFDGFITLSKEDIYGHTTLEALASGLPVISSNKVISSLDVINSTNGFLVSNKEETLNAIEKINNSLSASAIATAKKYTIENEVDKIYNDLKDIIGK